VADTGRSRGFSTLKALLWLAALGAAGWVTVAVAGTYYTAWKVQDIFDSVAQNMADRSPGKIREHLPVLYDLQGIRPGDLPREYYDNLEVTASSHGVRIASAYHVTLWLLGEPEGAATTGAVAEQLERLREMARLELDFSPAAETP